MVTYRFYSRLNPKHSVNIKYVRKDKFNEAANFMRKHYIDDPLMRSMGITERNLETQGFLSALWLSLLRSELSLAAVYRKEICGLCINCPHMPGVGIPNDILIRLAERVKTEATRNLLYSWDKISREAPVPTETTTDGQPKRIMELAGLAVANQYRRLGIAHKLVKSSAHLAMLLGFKYIRVDCTNAATAKICDRLGWRKIWEMPFENFHGVLPNSHALEDKEMRSVKVYFQPVNKDGMKSI